MEHVQVEAEVEVKVEAMEEVEEMEKNNELNEDRMSKVIKGLREKVEEPAEDTSAGES